MKYKQYCKARDEYYSKLRPTDMDFAEYTKAYFEWCDSVMKNPRSPLTVAR